MANVKDLSTLQDIDETEERFNIENLEPDSDEAHRLWTKHITIYEEWRQFWQPQIELGKKCMRYMRRDIFSRGQRKAYVNIDNKIPIEPQEAKPVINRLVKIITDSAPRHKVEMEDDDYDPRKASPEVVNTVIRWMEKKLDVVRKKRDLCHDAAITAFPCWLWMDKKPGLEGHLGELDATLLAWDRTLPAPWFMESDGSDIDDVFILSWYTKAELLKLYPGREDALKKHEGQIKDDPGYLGGILQNHVADVDSGERSAMYYEILMGSRDQDRDGRYLVIEHHFPVKKDIELYVNEDTYDAVAIPDHWDKQRKDEWIAAHPDYQRKITDEVNTQWVTTIGLDGFVWENDVHWFQKDGKLPGACYIVDMVDKTPTGPMEDMLPQILAIACCDTEALAEVRTGARTLTKVREGSIRHPHDLGNQLAKTNGVVTLKRNAPDDAITTDQRTPNPAFQNQAEVFRGRLLNTHGINPSLLGQTHQRKSGIVQSQDIEHGLETQSKYIQNYTSFSTRLAQLLVDMIPYCVTEDTIVQIDDEYGQTQEPVTVNQQGFDYSGQAQIVANDLSLTEYRVTPTITDDSPTERQRQLTEFVELIEAIGNSVLKLPRFGAPFLMSLPNRYAKEAGKFMLESVQAQEQIDMQKHQAVLQSKQAISAQRGAVDMEKLKYPKLNFKVDPKDIQEAPQGAQVLFQLLSAFNQQQDAQQQQRAAAAQQA
jgi:hypothetical protein